MQYLGERAIGSGGNDREDRGPGAFAALFDLCERRKWAAVGLAAASAGAITLLLPVLFTSGPIVVMAMVASTVPMTVGAVAVVAREGTGQGWFRSDARKRFSAENFAELRRPGDGSFGDRARRAGRVVAGVGIVTFFAFFPSGAAGLLGWYALRGAISDRQGYIPPPPEPVRRLPSPRRPRRPGPSFEAIGRGADPFGLPRLGVARPSTDVGGSVAGRRPVRSSGHPLGPGGAGVSARGPEVNRPLIVEGQGPRGAGGRPEALSTGGQQDRSSVSSAERPPVDGGDAFVRSLGLPRNSF